MPDNSSVIAPEEMSPEIQTLLGGKAARCSTARVLVSIILLLGLVDGILLGLGPMFVRLVELSICRAYYLEHDPVIVGHNGHVDESMCKINAIQAELAFVSGWLSFFETVPGILFGAYFGRLADRYGRKLVFLLNLIPLLGTAIGIASVCYFYTWFPNPRLVWVSALSNIVGGGPQMLGTMLYAMIADVTPMSRRAKVFIYATAAQRGIECIFTEAGSVLLTIDLYLPLKVGLPLIALAVLIVLSIPETSPRSVSEALLAIPTPEDVQGVSENTESASRSDTNASRDDLRTRYTHASNYATTMLSTFRNWRVVVMFIVFFVGVLHRGTFSHVLQYISAKFGWTIAEASKLTPIVDALNMLALLLVIPTVKRVLTYHLWSFEAIERFIILASLIAIASSNLLIAIGRTWQELAAGLFISALGCAITPALRSAITALVPNTSVAHLYSTITVVQMIGRLIVGPLFSSTFKLGLSIGMFGLPFLLVVITHVGAAMVFVAV